MQATQTAVRQGLCPYWTAANSVFFYTAMVGSLRKPWVAHAGRISSRETSGRQAARATPSPAALALTTSPAPTTPFEIYGWVLFAAATWTLPALMFITAGAAQMAIWAQAKHARLRKVRPLSPVHPACSTFSTLSLE